MNLVDATVNSDAECIAVVESVEDLTMVRDSLMALYKDVLPGFHLVPEVEHFEHGDDTDGTMIVNFIMDYQV